MFSSREAIIADIQEQIRRAGGQANEWCVGTAKDHRSQFFERHLRAEMNDGLMYREAFTASTAQAARDYLVSEVGLHPDVNEVPVPGRIVFAYRRMASAHDDPCTPAPHRLAE